MNVRRVRSDRLGNYLHRDVGDIIGRRTRKLRSLSSGPSLKHKTEVSENIEDVRTVYDPVVRPRRSYPLNERVGFWSYFWSELTSGSLKEEETDVYIKKQVDITNFIMIPIQIERFFWFGFLICFDSFLFLLSFLPFRILISTFQYFSKILSNRKFSSPTKIVNGVAMKSHTLKQSEVFDFVRGFLMVVCVIVLLQFDSDKLYHWIRGQAVIKLYVIFNVIEIFDRLFCSFGQDIFDALFLSMSMINNHGNTPQNSTHVQLLRPLTQLLIAMIYVCLHAIFLFVRIITLNAAVNSKHALLSLLLSNQFLELKSSVFKNFKESNLFQITCSDAVERFQLSTFLLIIFGYNLVDSNWEMTLPLFFDSVGVALLVIGSEFFVDWVKHAFITKFNEMPPSIYYNFSKILCSDIIAKSHDNENTFEVLDSSHTVARRLGFVPLPLACVVLRVSIQLLPIRGWLGWVLALTIWLNLLGLKVFIRLQLLGKAFRQVKRDMKTPADSELARTFQFKRVETRHRISLPPDLVEQIREAKVENEEETGDLSPVKKTNNFLEIEAKPNAILADTEIQRVRKVLNMDRSELKFSSDQPSINVTSGKPCGTNTLDSSTGAGGGAGVGLDVWETE